jgi:hypothetical protein
MHGDYGGALMMCIAIAGMECCLMQFEAHPHGSNSFPRIMSFKFKPLAVVSLIGESKRFERKSPARGEA